MSIKRFNQFEGNESLHEGESQVEAFKETITKVFMGYDKSKFSQKEREEIINWLIDPATGKFFSGLLTESVSNDMKKLRVELIWNREFDWSFYKEADDLESAIKFAKDIRDSGDGARVKSVRVVDEDDKVLWNG